MAEKIISPGVFTSEVDQTFLPAAVAEIGAVVVGPTVKGPAMIPTVVSSYSEYQEIFGDSFKSGSNYFQYLTSHTAENYLKHSDTLTVVRIMDGTTRWSTASVPTGSGKNHTGSYCQNGDTGAVLDDCGEVVGGNGLVNDANTSFKLHTLAHGHIMNNNPLSSSTNSGINTGSAIQGITGSNSMLPSGSKDNVRWEIASSQPAKGTF